MTRPLLQRGTQLTAEQARLPVAIGERLGGGTQGEVYKAEFDGAPVAVKWYFPAMVASDPKLRSRLRMAALRGEPSPAFLWPFDLVVAPSQSTFGYVMPLLDASYRGFNDLMQRKLSPSFRALATAAFELAEGYRTLHAMGLCYRDISFGNVALDPASGHIKICDNDNVDVNGAPGLVLGTPMFMALEIVTGRADPSTRTDLWSLAVLLFFAFIMDHPLLGRRELAFPVLDPPSQQVLFGSDARFIFDPADRSNEPVPGVHDNALAYWPLYPRFFQQLFVRSFTSGICDPGSRVIETEWRSAVVRLRDSIMRCPNCRAENFSDPAAGTAICWSCQRSLPAPCAIVIGQSRVVLTDGAELFPHHIDPNGRHNFSAPLAAFSRNPTQPDLFGLKNLGDRPWRAVLPNGQERQVDPGRTVALRPRTRIAFGRIEGVVG